VSLNVVGASILLVASSGGRDLNGMRTVLSRTTAVVLPQQTAVVVGDIKRARMPYGFFYKYIYN